jgi:predicted acylesterase/phospholipase RssA
VPLSRGPWFQNFCDRLTGALGKRVSTRCLSAADLGEHGAPVRAIEPGDDIPDSLRRWLDRCESETRLLIYVADDDNTAWSRLAIRQADMILLLADANDEPAPGDWEKQLLDSEGATTARRALILRHPVRDAVITGTRRWLDGRDIEFHLHLRGDSEAETGRIVRLLMGDSVGLVLGGGAARGFAEVGAYRAMHEAGVPVDWIGGTSIGGIIGAAIALDEGPDYVTENARKAFVEGKPFGDYTLPVVSLIKGRRMERLTRHHLKGNIEDLPIPFFCVSALLDTGELRIEERGSIWRALRATAALPGLMPPAVMDRRLVVDGSVVNNLPIDIMRRKPVGRVVAVDVTTRRTYQVDYEALPSSLSVFGSRVMPWRKRYRVPGVISVLMKSAEIGTAARVREMAASADLLIRPPVSEFSLTDVNSFDRIVAAGYDHAKEQFSKWMSADERIAPRAE